MIIGETTFSHYFVILTESELMELEVSCLNIGEKYTPVSNIIRIKPGYNPNISGPAGGVRTIRDGGRIRATSNHSPT